MEPLTVDFIINVIQCKDFHGPSNLVCHRVTTDSREIEAGDLFVGIAGPNFHGSDFYREALNKGATMAIIEPREVRALPPGTGVCNCEDALAALQNLSKAYRNQFDIPVVGITGSVGKTTLTSMITAIVKEAYQSIHKTYKNFNGQVGLPLSLFHLERQHRISVLEMGISKPGEMERLVDIANPTMAVISRITCAHTEFFEDENEIADEKWKIFHGLKAEQYAILNNEDPHLMRRLETLTCRKKTFGLNPGADVHLVGEAVQSLDSLKFRCNLAPEVEITLPVIGRFNLVNALAAIAVGDALGVDMPTIANGLATFSNEPLRMETLHLGDDVIILNDTYNASLESMRGALETLAEIGKGRRKVAVLGDMYELGEFSVEHHKQVGRLVAKYGIDLLLAIGEYARWILPEAVGVVTKGALCRDTEEAKRLLKDWLESGDIVLIKASRGMMLERLADYLKQLKSGND